jgi:ribonucleoside-diphosphate reductase alpha chain
MKIKKRDGRLENLSFDKIVYRLKKLANDKVLGQLKVIDTDVIAQKVVSTIYDGVSSTELDEEAARIAISMTENLEFGKLASRLVISNIQKNTTECFSEVMEKLYGNVDSNGNPAPVLADDIINIVRTHRNILNEAIDYSRDYLFDYFGFKTLEKSYLMKLNGKVIERPQHLYMRVAIQVHKDSIEDIIKTYELISQHYFTFASPTLFNAGSRLQNLSSCFHEDTQVATLNKGPIKIKDVEIDDLVITHLGNVKKVQQLHKNLLNNRKLYEIKIAKTTPIKVTDNHKLYVIKKIKKNNWVDYYDKPTWISIENLEKGDYVSIPNKIQNITYVKELDTLIFKDLIQNKTNRKSNYTVNLTTDNKIVLKTHWEHNGWDHVEDSVKCSKEHSSINRYWKINHSFAKFLGIFYGDGHIMSNKDTHGNLVLRGIGITIHNMNEELVNYCKEIGHEIFGINPTVHIMKEQNIIQVLYNSVFIGEIFNELFGRHFNNKKIWNEMYKWDKKMIISLLEGLVTTDGCISTSNVLSFQMSNVKFMRDLYYLLRNNNIDTSYGKEKRAKNGTENHVCINIPISEIDKDEVNKYYTDNRMKYEYKPKCKNQFSAKIVNGFKFLKFESKIEIIENLPEYVYTLGIEDDHSYNIGGIIAENCFLLGTDDSIGGIYKTISDCAQISKVGGGIGVHINNIRSKGSVIRGTNGHSDGIIPMLKVYNSTCLYVNQSGKRKGSFAMYLSPEHPDIFEFLDLRKNQGSEDMRARDLFLAMWISDLFMKQVELDGDWYLMDPDECPGLSDKYGDEYEELYWKYVEQGKYKRKIKAQEIWMKILESQIETGTPYILYKDQANKKSNQKNIGTIKSSNLCAEILLYSDHQEYAVCNLASIALPKYVEIDPETKLPFYNHQKLFEVAKHIVLPMNNVIDFNHYPVPETRKSNLSHRPIGVGIQGLSCSYIKMRLPFESEEAKKLNKEIFETIYFALLTGSMEMAKKDGHYSTFKGSPMSEGKLQFDLWAEHNGIDLSEYLSGRWDWESLRNQIKEHGVRNSTLTTCMPTASSAQIMGNTESFECFDSCIFKRRVLSGEYIVANKYLVEDLTRLKLWDKELKDLIIANNGSVQNIDIIPDDIKDLYKTVWEITMKNFIDQSAQRGPFIDMTQSLNLFMASPTVKKLTSMHFYAWRQGLKTGIYYLRSKASSSASKFTIDPNMEKKIKEKQKKGKSLTKKEEEAVLMCSIENKEDCMMCTS